MLHRNSRAWSALWGAISFALLAPAARCELPLRDPFSSETKVAPAPGVLWQPTAPLPAVPAPERGNAVPSTEALSLPALTEFALRNNPRTRQAWLAARAAAAGVSIEQADLLPQITANYTGSRAQQISATSGAVVPWQTRFGPSISFSYVLFDFGVRALQVETAEYRLLAANLAQNRTLQDVVFQVEQAYYRLIGLDALVRANDQFLQNTKTALEAAQKRRESGLATVADVYRAETQVAQASLVLTRSRGEFEKARGQLATAVGLPVNASVKVQSLTAPPQVREVTTTVSTLLEQAKTGRPDLVAAEAQARAARSNATAVSRAGLPSIEVNGAGGHTIFGDNRPSASSYNLGLNLRIPIFTGFRDTYSARQAEAQAQLAEATRDTLYAQTELEVWQSYYDLQTVTSNISSAEAQVRSAEQTAQATLARYQSGFGTILDLVTAQQEEANARAQRIQSYLDWFTTLARLNFAIGTSDLLTSAGGRK